MIFSLFPSSRMRQQEAAANRFSGGLVGNRTVSGYTQSGYVGQPGYSVGQPGYVGQPGSPGGIRPPSIRTSSPAASYRPPSAGYIRPPSTGVRTPVGMSQQRSLNASQPMVSYRPQSVGTVNYNVPPPVRFMFPDTSSNIFLDCFVYLLLGCLLFFPWLNQSFYLTFLTFSFVDHQHHRWNVPLPIAPMENVLMNTTWIVLILMVLKVVNLMLSPFRVPLSVSLLPF